MQRYIAFPEEVWSWEKYDHYVLGNISYLIGDEFFDGELPEGILQTTTCYSLLKKWRKNFKDAANRRSFEEFFQLADRELPRFLNQFLPLWRECSKRDGHLYGMCAGILSQTRGCGTPPPLVLIQSKVKFLLGVSEEHPPLEEWEKAVMRTAIDDILEGMDESAFTGLETKARVSVTTTASWEKTRKEGGTIEEIEQIVHGGKYGYKAVIRDLETGKPEKYVTLDEVSAGEYIFWRCLDEVLKTPEDELKYAYLTIVKEPGKGRSVTKARACLKVVLDTVNKLCSWPLARGVESSQSGMLKAHHGWNLYQSLMTEEEASDMFHVIQRDETVYGGYVERTDTYADLFFSSTDFEEATDAMNHEWARIAGLRWMTKCGIPRFLRAIVDKTCYRPRKIFFKAEAGLANIGNPTDDPTVRWVTLRKGVLMGDPLTKVLLHLTNVASRHTGANMGNVDFWRKAVSNPVEAAQAFDDGLHNYRPAT
jgi:hypothetical protein